MAHAGVSNWWPRPFIIILLFLISATWAGVLKELTELTFRHETSCVLPTTTEGDFRCSNIESNLVEVVKDVPRGTICEFLSRGTTVVYECDRSGIWIELVSHDIQVVGLLSRKKRFIQFLAPIIGAVLGGIAGIITASKSGGGGPPPMTPPSVQCPQLGTIWTDEGKTTAIANWKRPIGNDKEDGEIDSEQVSGIMPGQELSEGTHFAQYKVTDSQGLTAYCTVNVVVKVHRCDPLQWPRDGFFACTKGRTFGSQCTLNCDSGYEIPAGRNTSYTCVQSESWEPSGRPQCSAKKCPSAPTVDNGQYSCMGDLEYKTTCSLSCSRGYVVSGSSMIMCGQNGQWSAAGECVDNESPTFPGGCPDDIDVFPGPVGQEVSVTWTSPVVRDNSGKSPTLTSTSSPGDSFTMGKHSVRYTATDAAGNIATCRFYVTVQTLSCQSPALDDSGKNLMLYDCPDNYLYGANCSLSCRSGYPLVGPTDITCIKDDSVYPPQTSWSWNDVVKPRCRVIPCQELNPPQNGALSCDNWGNGRMCSMLCNDNFDIPLQVLTDGMFVCGTSTGLWKPTDKVPDCSERKKPNSMNLPSELYYTGQCSDDATKTQIKEKFIQILKTSSKFPEKCGGNVPECRADMVTVTCGPVVGRRRRRSAGRNKRSGFGYLVEFSIITDYEENGKTASETEALYNQVFNGITDVLKQEITSGLFDLTLSGGERLKAEDFASGSPLYDCPAGTRMNIQTKSCSGCSKGTHYNVTTRSCSECPIGFYQDENFASDCKACPNHTTTTNAGAKDVNNCTALCQPGHFSTTGLAPCLPCPVGSFQSAEGKTECVACPAEYMTMVKGATNHSDCLGLNACKSTPCGNHTCVDVPGSYECRCHEGYSGSHCDTPPDNCYQHACQNGATCESNIYNYTCLCSEDFTGELCQVQIIHGQWSEWEEWTQCSVTCGGGNTHRGRRCDNPAPGPGGRGCQGTASETAQCNTEKCPSCGTLSRPYGVQLRCNESEDQTGCIATCRPGLVFAEEPHPVYACGRTTGYVWSHVTENNPDGRIPSCTESHAPVSTTTKQSVQHTMSCGQVEGHDTEIKIQLLEQTENLECVKSRTCTAEVDVSGCDNGGGDRQKRSVSGDNVTLSITLTTQQGASKLDLEAVFENNTMTASVKSYVDSMIKLALSTEYVANNTLTMFTINAGGATYTPSVQTAHLTAVMKCPPGTVLAGDACGECPPGTREAGGVCVLCGKGSYQDETAKTSCKPCSAGKTTPGLGSESFSQCTADGSSSNGGSRDPDNDTDDADDSSNGGSRDPDNDTDDDKSSNSLDTLTIVLAVVAVAFAASLIIPFGLWMHYKHRNKRVSAGAPDLGSPREFVESVPPYSPPPSYKEKM